MLKILLMVFARWISVKCTIELYIQHKSIERILGINT
jgi:hypothetical protein